MDSAPEEIVRHYESNDEGRRITTGLGRLELLRTQELLRRHLPDRPARIIDLGGATGVHASWLATDGHDVHVVDLLAHHVEETLRQGGGSGRITAEVGDARQLPVLDESFDAALLLGRLYHLTDRDDRQRAWAEARRVVRPGGVIFGAAISRFASLFDGLSTQFLFEPEFRKIAERDLSEGQHRNRTDRAEWFTTAFFHHPDELRAEAQDSGLEVVELVGVEGMAKWLPQLEDRWATPEGQETILFSARCVETEPTLLGLSAHLLIVTRR